MNGASRNGLRQESAEQKIAADRVFHLAMLAFVFTAITLLYRDTFVSIVSIWLRSDTFLHGFLIAPISLYLVWENRGRLRKIMPTTYGPALLVLLGLSLAWWISDALGIQVGSQMLAIAMFPAAVVAIMGLVFARAIAFPLAYLVFAVPFGEALIPWLMDYTASFTVGALNLTGIPVLREGLYFSIPSGNFEVAKACSGVRYLLATLALGVLYSYLAYQSRLKRLLFIGFAIVMPIVANGIRAYAIVLIAHFSEMRLAVGVDHIIFGWVFFGIVLTIMFMVGNRYRDDVPPTPPASRDAGFSPAAQNTKARAIFLSMLAVACVMVGPVLIPAATATGETPIAPTLHLPGQIDGWHVSNRGASNWQPNYIAAAAEGRGRFVSGNDVVDLAIVQYHGRGQDAELVNSENRIADPQYWLIESTSKRPIVRLDGRRTVVRSVFIRSGLGSRLIWYWYNVNGQHSVSGLGVKFLEGKAMLGGNGSVSSLIAISTSISESPEAAGDVLGRFYRDASATIDACLHDAAAASDCRPVVSMSLQD